MKRSVGAAFVIALLGCSKKPPPPPLERAAIGADWSVVVVLGEKTVKVYAPEGDAEGFAKVVATRPLPRPVEWLSLAEPGIVLLESQKSGTRLTALSRKALPAFLVDVPFPAYQPAISGAPGRLYVAGRGLCAIDKGKLT